MNRSLAGMLSLLFCVGIFTFIYMQHQVLVKEVESIEKSAQVPAAVVKDLKQGSNPPGNGIAYKTDPANEPLAPAVKHATPASAPAQKSAHETPKDSPVLVQ